MVGENRIHRARKTIREKNSEYCRYMLYFKLEIRGTENLCSKTRGENKKEIRRRKIRRRLGNKLFRNILTNL